MTDLKKRSVKEEDALPKNLCLYAPENSVILLRGKEDSAAQLLPETGMQKDF